MITVCALGRCVMKRTISLVLTILLLFALLGCNGNKAPANLSPGWNIFVSPSGSDMADGSFAAPFATLQRAQLEVRALLGTQNEPITVNIRAGEYYMAQSLFLDAEDSGTADAPVTWQGYNGESVLLSGGIRLSSDQFETVTDPAILSRVLDEKARDNLVRIDLSGYLNEIPLPVVSDTPGGIQIGMPAIYIDNEALVSARYPNDVQNEAYIYADSAKALSDEPYSGATLTSSELADRMKNWSPDAWKEMYVYSFLAWEWDDIMSNVTACDMQSGAVTTAAGALGPPTEHPRFYVFNLLEEIDLPGESYIDYENRVVYFYPPEGFEKSKAYLSLQESALVDMEYAEHITLRGLTLGYTRGVGIQGNWVKDITIDGCKIMHCSNTAVSLDAATNCTVRNCNIYDTENCGIYLWDGDLRKTLTPSGNMIENNDISDNNRNRRSYQPLIWCSSMGVIIKNNRLHDNTCCLLDISTSNDAIIEYNEFYGACRDVSDAGAIYYGRNPSVCGVIIRYNYFHDIGNIYGGYGQQAIFCDDGAAMPYIYGNIFANASDQTPEWGSVIKANGAQFGVVKNNVFIDSPTAAGFYSWTFSWDKKPVREDSWIANIYGTDDPTGHFIWQKLTEEVDFFSDEWKAHYRNTQWAPVWDYITPEGYAEAWKRYNSANGEYPFDYDENPEYYDYFYRNAPQSTNLFEDNVCVNIEQMFFDNGRGERNLSLGTDIFKDYANGDFSLTAQALEEIRKVIPEFEEIPLNKIGLQ